MTDTTKTDAATIENCAAAKPASKSPARRMAREPKTSAPTGNQEPKIKPGANDAAEVNAKKLSPQLSPRPESKIAAVIAMLQRAEGATLEQMVAATGWLPHTTRAALTGLKKKGHTITKDKIDGVNAYKITATTQS